MKQLTQVNEFNKQFNVPTSEKPTLFIPERSLLRFTLLEEEVEEYYTATAQDDLTSVLDSLCDIQYVLCGAILEHGLQDVFEAAFSEVHRSNMAKTGGGERSDGKIMKPEGWKGPDLKQFIK